MSTPYHEINTLRVRLVILRDLLNNPDVDNKQVIAEMQRLAFKLQSLVSQNTDIQDNNKSGDV